MSKTRKYRGKDGAARRRAFAPDRARPQRSLLRRADCCGAMVAADPARMGARWADVHEPGCPVPWQQLGLPGGRRDVYPGMPGIPASVRLRAVNRKRGSVPATPDHAAPAYRDPGRRAAG